MLRALYTSATGMKAQELLIDNTANNLANVNTTGFRKSHLDFADLVYSTLRQPGTAVNAQQVSPTGLQVGNGVRPVSTTKHFLQGTLEATNNPLDIAIEGDGFFQLQDGNGQFRYSRAGNFQIDGQTGTLVNPDGLILQPAIVVPPDVDITKISVSNDGVVMGVSSNSDAAPVNLGQIQLATFVNPAGLSSEGGNVFAETPASGAAVLANAAQAGVGQLRNGFLESSNVEVVGELISLISAQRAYEINSRAIRAGDEMLQTSADIVR